MTSTSIKPINVKTFLKILYSYKWRILLLLLVLQVILLIVYVDMQHVMMPMHAEMCSSKYYITW